jgi:ATP-binding cassette subfamily B protein
VLLDSSSIHFGHIGTGLVLLIGAQAIASGTFSVGDFALFVVYLDQLIWYPAEIARLITDLKRVDVSFERMRAVAPSQPAAALVAAVPFAREGVALNRDHATGDRHEQTTVRQSSVKRLQLLEVRGLSYVYPSSAGGIRDVSLSLKRGSFTLVTGRIGAGKSTLLHVLLGLLQRQSGEIRWNGVLIEDPATFFVPPRSAFTPQIPRLFSESLRDNLLLGRTVGDAALGRAVHAAVLEPDVETMERGLDTLVGPRGKKLSGGQVQRAAVARMLLADAELLVFDDVSSALDAETEAELWSRLFARRGELTCLVVSHRPVALNRADQVLVMEGGKLSVQV